jgi:hypothetical protein
MQFALGYSLAKVQRLSFPRNSKMQEKTDSSVEINLNELITNEKSFNCCASVRKVRYIFLK